MNHVQINNTDIILIFIYLIQLNYYLWNYEIKNESNHFMEVAVHTDTQGMVSFYNEFKGIMVIEMLNL